MYRFQAPSNQDRRDEKTQTNHLIFLHLILKQLENDLTALILRMLHADLHRATTARCRDTFDIAGQSTGKIDSAIAAWGHIIRARTPATIVEADDVASWNDLAKTTVHRVADLDEIVVEEDEEFPVQTGCVSASYELENHAARYVAVFVHVDGAFGVRDEELAVAETEHAQWSEVVDAVCYAGEVGLRFWGF